MSEKLRTGVLIDTSNLHMTAMSSGFGKPNYAKLVSAVSVYKPEFVIIYIPEIEQTCGLINYLRSAGYTVKTKPLVVYGDGHGKCNFDVEITMDLLLRNSQYDKLTLFSGDGDFAEVLKFLTSAGKVFEIVAYQRSLNKKLISYSQNVYLINPDGYSLNRLAI